MRLSELNAVLFPSPKDARLLSFDCPCGCAVGVCLSFTPGLDGSIVPEGRHPWQRVSGTTIEDITLEPSIRIYPSGGQDCKGWHGYIRNGEVSA